MSNRTKNVKYCAVHAVIAGGRVAVVGKLLQLRLVEHVDLVDDLELLRGVSHANGCVQLAEDIVHSWLDVDVTAEKLAQHALPVLAQLSLLRYLRNQQSMCRSIKHELTGNLFLQTLDQVLKKNL